MIIRIFDTLSAVLIVVGLNLVTKTHRGWLIYALGSIFFIVVCVASKLWGLTIMGIILLATAIKNYIVEKKKTE